MEKVSNKIKELERIHTKLFQIMKEARQLYKDSIQINKDIAEQKRKSNEMSKGIEDIYGDLLEFINELKK